MRAAVVILAAACAASSGTAWAQAPAPSPSGQPPPAAVAPLTAEQYFTYEQEKKLPLLGMGLGFIPGMGSLYGRHLTGAFISWGAIAAGVPLIVYATHIGGVKNPYTGETEVHGTKAGLILTAGVFLIVGAEVYSVIDGYRASKAHNRALARRLGFQDPRLTVAPLSTGRDLAWGPAFAVRF